MLKNKIYKYLTLEIFKSFLTILFAFTTIAWTVRAVNFLDLMVEDGYSVLVYLEYSLYNITTILARFIPLSFLFALIISILKFERQHELIILWTSGLSKIKIVNLFFSISIVVTIMQILWSVIITPTTLNKSRSLLKSSEIELISSVIRSKDFSDTFEQITIYVEEKNENNEMLNIFIRDNTNALGTIVSAGNQNANTTIVANKGVVRNNKLILFNGFIQSQSQTGEINNIEFNKTILTMNNFSTRTITTPKIQETSTLSLLQCFFNLGSSEKSILNCPYKKNKVEVAQNISRRIGMPLYIPLIALIGSFLLIHKRREKFGFLKKYLFFLISFFVLVFSEIMVKFSGLSLFNFLIYFLFPFTLMPIVYFMLIQSIKSEKLI
jgi:lipopolysaccharide export system permease protein